MRFDRLELGMAELERARNEVEGKMGKLSV